MATKTTPGAVKQIHYLAAALKAPRITDAAQRLADQARDAGWTHEDCLAAVLEREVSARNASGAQLRIRAAGFPARKTLEGLYSSQVTEWCKLRDAGVLEGRPAGARVGRLSAEHAEIARLRGQLDNAQRRLARTEVALDIMGKAHALGGDLRERAGRPTVHTALMIAFGALTAAGLTTRDAAGLTGVARATAGRAKAATMLRRPPRPVPANRLSAAERVEVVAVLNSAEFVDRTPLQVYAVLLARGRYLCSVSSMYRVGVPAESFASTNSTPTASLPAHRCQRSISWPPGTLRSPVDTARTRTLGRRCTLPTLRPVLLSPACWLNRSMAGEQTRPRFSYRSALWPEASWARWSASVSRRAIRSASTQCSIA